MIEGAHSFQQGIAVECRLQVTVVECRSQVIVVEYMLQVMAEVSYLSPEIVEEAGWQD